MMKKIPVYWKTLLILLLLTAIMALAGFITPFCDWYTNALYPYLCDGTSHVTGPVPVAVGEIIMYLGALSLVFGVIFLIMLIFKRKNEKYRRFCGGYFKTLLMALICIVFIYMPAWYLPFRCSVLDRGNTEAKTDYKFEEIKAVVTYAVEGINSAAAKIEINPDGTVDFPEEREAAVLIADAMNGLSDEYPRLKGYYPPVKTALCSDILETMSIGGYNYPFTMEPTRNKYIDPMNVYCLNAHEYCHHKGYEKENEANFLSELALSRSDDPFLRFSAFWDMYWWIIDDFSEEADAVILEQMHKAPGDFNFQPGSEDIELYNKIADQIADVPHISARANRIIDASNDIGIQIYEADPHPIEEMPQQVETVIEEVSDTGWEVQGEILKENSYDGVTLLWLQYFDEMKNK